MSDVGEPARGSGNWLVLLTGQAAELEIPLGRVTAGRSPDAAVHLDHPGVSRHHASLETHHGRTVIADLGSTNGTWVGGTRVTDGVVLEDGDVVELGGARLQFRVGRRPDLGRGWAPGVGTAAAGPPGGGRPQQAPGGGRRTNLTSALVVASLTEALVLGSAVVASFLTSWTGRFSWLVAPMVGVAVAMGKILIGEVSKPRTPAQTQPVPTYPTSPAPHATAPGPADPRVGRRKGTPVAVAVLVVLLVLGGGGLAVTLGVRYVTGVLTGNEAGVERLVAPVQTTDQGLTLAVESVVHTPRFTRVGVAVTNGLGNTVTLPLFQNAFLSTGTGETLEADPFRSDFAETIPPGAVRRGTLVFPGHPPVSPTSLSLSFATVHEQGFDGPDSLVLPGIDLGAYQEAST